MIVRSFCYFLKNSFNINGLLSETICWKESISGEDKINKTSRNTSNDNSIDKIVSRGPQIISDLGAKALIMNKSPKDVVDKEKFSKDYLSCWYSNATSLNNKFDEFIEEINASKSQVVFVCETWWTDKSATNVPGYNLFRKDRQFSRGGGVCIYIRDNLNSYPVN